MHEILEVELVNVFCVEQGRRTRQLGAIGVRVPFGVRVMLALDGTVLAHM